MGQSGEFPHIYIYGTGPVRTVFTTYGADRLLGPTLRPQWSWDRGGLKDPSGANLHIKFEVNLMPLTPSSVVYKFCSFISNKKN